MTEQKKVNMLYNAYFGCAALNMFNLAESRNTQNTDVMVIFRFSVE